VGLFCNTKDSRGGYHTKPQRTQRKTVNIGENTDGRSRENIINPRQICFKFPG